MDCVKTIAGMVGKPAWDFIQPHLGYLFCYKNNIDNMEEKFRELVGIRTDVQQQVDAAARERVEEVKNEVKNWLDNVMKVEKVVLEIRASAEKNKCFINFCLHYTLGSQAADQIKAIDDLIVKKGNFNGVSLSRLPPSTTGSLLVTEGYMMLDSRKSYINEILNAFKDETVHVIGVYGMGGVGKTTLVKEAVKQAKKDNVYTEVVMVTVPQNLDVKSIQTGIAENLGLELNEGDVQVRADKIEERLKKGNRVLVILDDLWKKLELSEVRIPYLNKEGSTCRVVITTRQENICLQMECQKTVLLKTLSDEESWLLFKSRAGNVVEYSPTMKEVAWNVAKQCAGLPLALVVLGTALKGQKLEVWKTVLNQLKKSTMTLDLKGVSDTVLKSIELSCDFLEGKAAKWCFLHCCLYPKDDDIYEKDLMHMLVGGGFLEDVESLHEAQDRVHLLMDQLKASCLLLKNVTLYDVESEVDDLMHMLIGGGFLEDVESLHEAQDRVHALMDQLQTSILIHKNATFYDVESEVDDLMHKLIGGGLLEDVESLHEARDRVHVLMGKLKASFLLFRNVALYFSSKNEAMNDVESDESDVDDFMDVLAGEGFMEDVKRLPEEQDIYLAMMEKVKETYALLHHHWERSVRMHDVVRDAAILIGERDHGFFVRARRGLEEWPRDYTDEKLQNCRLISLMYNKIVDLPSDPIKCRKLETLTLQSNMGLSNIPEMFFQHMGALKVLDLSSTQISSLPQSLSCLTNLRVLNLNNCIQLEDISHINGLKMLEILDLAYTCVSVVPEDTIGLPNLRLLDLGNKDTIISPSSYFSNVLRAGCSRLEQLFIPEYEGCLAELASLRFLTHLHIWGDAVDSNDSLSQDLGSSRSWIKLQEFLICFVPSGCTCFLPHRKGSRSLHLTRTKLFSPSLMVLLEKTENLALVDCEESEVISSNCDIPPHVFHSLTQLLVSGCLYLTSLGDDESLLPNLKFMRVENCPMLARLLPSKVWQSLHQLKKLEVIDCTAMQQLFPYDHPITELLPKLAELQLSKLPQLESVLQPFQCLPNLRILEIRECELRCGLAYHEMEMASDPFPKLKKLYIIESMEMRQMISSSSSPDAPLQGMCIFQNITHLFVAECPRLTHLFWSKQAKHMQQLTCLEIYNCDSLRAVVISNENQEEGESASASTSTSSFFPRLTKLILKGLPEITAFHQPSTALLMEWPCLEEHLIEDCPKLETPLLGPQTSERSRVFEPDELKRRWAMIFG